MQVSLGASAKQGLKKKLSLEGVEYNRDYYTKVVERAEKKWKLKMQPHVMTKEEI